MHSEPNREADDLLERATAALRDAPVQDGPSPLVTAKALAALRAAGGPSFAPPKRSLSMRSVLQAAVCTMAVLGGCVYVVLSLSYVPNSLYAQAVEKLQHAKAVSFRSGLSGPGESNPTLTRVTYLDGAGVRSEMPGDVVRITTADARRSITLDRGRKSALITEITSAEPSPGAGPDATDFVNMLKHLGETKGELLGEGTVAGSAAQKFRSKFGAFEAIVWVDKREQRIVRIEATVPRNGGDATLIFTDVQIDPPVDPKDFSLTPPEGYTLQKSKLEFNPNPMDNVVFFLSEYSRRFGTFPAKLDDWGDTVGKLTKAANGKELDPAATKLLSAMGATTAFTFGWKKGVEYDYHPQVKVGDAKAVVFWATLDGKTTALYGDLRVAPIDPKELPKK
jgi:outer membrane lipoprotein-sorting protein